MRVLTLFLVAGLVLAVGQSAWALTLTNYTAGDLLVFHFDSMDAGTKYAYNVGGVPYIGIDAVNGATIAGPVGGNPAGGRLAEDAWGIAVVTSITNSDASVTYWDATTSPTELTSLFFGVVDQSLSNLKISNTIDLQDSFSTGFKFAMYEDAAKNYDATQGPAARAGVMAYPTVTDGTLILEAAGVPGILDTIQTVALGVPVYADHGASAILVWDSAAHNYVTQVQQGSGHAYASVADLNGDNIATGSEFANGAFPTANPAVTADIRLDWTLWPPGTAATNPWWDLADSDPVAMTSNVPEPVTMAGMLLGVGCLGRYIRKRR